MSHDKNINFPNFLDETTGRIIPLKVFGAHNLKNLSAALNIGLRLGLEKNKIFESISEFEGAAQRLEKLWEKKSFIAFRDFAHAPSKVKATVQAVRQQFPHHHFVAVLELHTFSSLSKNYISQYHASLQLADEAIVFFDSETIRLKKLPPLSTTDIKLAFGPQTKVIESDVLELKLQTLKSYPEPTVFVFMSSGHWKGLNWKNELVLAYEQ